MSGFQAREIWTPGTVVDRKYVVHSTLGRGGFGTVYLARHRLLGHDYVIKRLHSQYAEDPHWHSDHRQQLHRLLAHRRLPNHYHRQSWQCRCRRFPTGFRQLHRRQRKRQRHRAQRRRLRQRQRYRPQPSGERIFPRAGSFGHATLSCG